MPSELFRKLAVMVEVFPRSDGVLLQIVPGEVVTINCNHGSASNEPPPPASPPALSQVPEAVGPVLQPHQLFSAFTFPTTLPIGSSK